MRARLDRGPHGVPRGCQLSGQSCNDGCLEAQLSDRQRIARTPKRARGAHTFPLCSRNVTVWQVRSQHIQRRIVRRILAGTPAQGRVDHLHHDAPVTVSKSPHNSGSQHSGHRTLCRAPEHLGCEPRSSDGNPPSQRADHADHNGQAIQSSSR